MTVCALPSISVVIVTYNSSEYLRETLESVFSQDYPDYEVVLVDNASHDNSLEVAKGFADRGLKIVERGVNRGFSGGCNDGVKDSRGEIVFLVNPDVVMEKDCLRDVAGAFSERVDMGILGVKLVATDGETILHCGGFVSLPAHSSSYGRGEKDRGQWDRVMEVDYVAGAALAIRREFWDRLGGFDEDFNPAYFEDTDLCFRCRQLGKKVIYYPIRMIHHENVSCDYKSMQFYMYHHKNRLWFTAKNSSFPTLLFKAFPSELKWYFSPQSKGLRKPMLKLYWLTLKKYVKRIFG